MGISVFFDEINKWYFDKNALKTYELVRLLQGNTDLITEFEVHLKLTFIAEKVVGNVCFASNSDVRPEFGTTFRAIDVVDYLCAALNQTKIPLKMLTFQFPNDTDLFWKFVELGAQLRKE